jgi:hypothetical protein
MPADRRLSDLLDGLYAGAAEEIAWHDCLLRVMSASGQTRRFDLLTATSGLPLASDVPGPGWHVSKVPTADIGREQMR